MNIIVTLKPFFRQPGICIYVFLTRYVPDRYDIDNTDYFGFKIVFGTAGPR